MSKAFLTILLGAIALIAEPASAQQASVTGDMNGDGRADILWHHVETGANYTYVMNGLAILSQDYINTIDDPSWQLVGEGDFNGDGKADILWRNTATGENYVYLMSGSVIVASGRINVIPDPNWQVVGLADFDGDGKCDILWRNMSTGLNYIYFMNGLTILVQVSVNAVADQSWQVGAVADLNGDGKADILWRNHSTGQVYVYLMNGALIGANGIVTVISDQNWTIAGAGDFNADHKADIVWHHVVTGATYVYAMDGLSILSQHFVNAPPAEWQIVAVADFNGDGGADMLWRNVQTGANYMYLMTGTAIGANGVINIVPDMNWQVGSDAALFGGPVVPLMPSGSPAQIVSLPMTQADIENMNISGAPYYITLQAILERAKHPTFTLERDAQNSPMVPLLPSSTIGNTAASIHTDAIDAVVETTENLTPRVLGPADPSQYAEPTTTTMYFGGVYYTTTVYARLISGGSFLTATTSTSAGAASTAGLLIPGDSYSNSADPYVDRNAAGYGDSPLTVWCSGILFKSADSAPSAVALWRSTNGGLEWSAPLIVSEERKPDNFLDKPALAVNTNYEFQGRVYVAFVRIVARATTEIHLARVRRISIAGTEQIGVDQDLQLATGNSLGAPQVIVRGNTGMIYVLYADYTPGASQFKMVSILDSVTGPMSVAQTEDVLDPTFERAFLSGGINGGRLKDGIRAITVPVARYDSRWDRIHVVWNQMELHGGTNPPKTDVFYSYRECSGDNSWSLPVAISNIPGVDELLPAVDVIRPNFRRAGAQSSGTGVIVTYYRRDANNALYADFFRTWDPATGDSSQTWSPARMMTNEDGTETWYDVTALGAFPSFLGDYQDVWTRAYDQFDAEGSLLSTIKRSKAVWIRAPRGDVMMTAIQELP